MSELTSHTIRVGILFGGKSTEHDVSILSAQSIMGSIDKKKFTAIPIYIDRSSIWHHGTKFNIHTRQHNPLIFIPDNKTGDPIDVKDIIENVDCIFPVLHGPHGEDGSVQGFMDLANMPYVGTGILGSALGMDKDITKRLLHESGIVVAKTIVIHLNEKKSYNYDSYIAELGLPLFVKPANMGSSVGVSKVTTKEALAPAIAEAFRYDRKILLEAAIEGYEIECAILGNSNPEASTVGRITTQADFYNYQEKYHDTHLTSLEIPAKIPNDLIEKAQQIALRVFRVLECEGMARVDMFVTKEEEIIVNEINTIPGFTRFSMYPRLWEVSGLSYTNLLTKLIDLGLERFKQREKLATDYAE